MPQVEDDYILNETPDEDMLPDEPIYDDENDYDQEEKPGIRDRYDDAKDKYERARDLRDRYERWKEKRQFKEADEAATQKPEQAGKQTPEEAKDLKGEAGKGAPETEGAKVGANKAPSDLKGEIGRPIPEGGAAGRAAGGVGRTAGGVGEAAGAVEGAGGVAGGAGAAAEGVGGTAATVGGGAAAWWVILIIVIILLIVAFLMFAAGFIVGLTSGGGMGNNMGTTGYAGAGIDPKLLYPSGCSDDAIVAAMQKFIPAKSPLYSKIPYMVASAKKAGINPFMVAVQARKESSFAMAGSLIDDFNPFGLKRDGPCGKRSEQSSGAFARFGSWEEAIDSYVNTSLKCYFTLGDRTLEQVIYRYAPPKDKNDTPGYLKDAQQWLGELYTSSGCSVGTPTEFTGSGLNPSSDDGIVPFATQSMLRLTSPNIDQGLRRPSYIVLHFTGGNNDPRGGFQSGVNNNNGSMLPVKDEYRAYVHFYVDKSGKIYQLAPTNRSVRGAGGFNLLSSNGSVLKGINNIKDIPADATISIHIENQGTGAGALTDAQAEADAKIAKFLMEKYGIPAGNIIGHDKAYQLVIQAGADAGYGSERYKEPGESFMSKVRAKIGSVDTGGTAATPGMINCNDAVAGGATATEAMKNINVDNNGNGTTDGLSASQKIISDIQNGGETSTGTHVSPSPKVLGLLVLLDKFAEEKKIGAEVITFITGWTDDNSEILSNAHRTGRAINIKTTDVKALGSWLESQKKAGLVSNISLVNGTFADSYHIEVAE